MKLKTSEAADWAGAVEALDALRQELARLGQRVAALEVAIGAQPGASAAAPGLAVITPPESPPKPQHEGLSEELVIVISAAIAAFLGKKPHIRQIRLLGSPAWAEHGRVTIQASHALSTHHARTST